MAALDCQFFGVPDDRPIRRDRGAHDGELDEGARLADGAQALLDRSGGTSRFNVDIAAVALGHVQNGLHHVFGARIKGMCRAELFGAGQAVVGQVNGDDGARRLQAGVGDDAQADGPAARHDHHITELDAAASDGVHGASQRLDQGGVFNFEALRDLVVDRTGRELQIVGPAARRATAEAVDVVDRAQVVQATPAVAA